MTIESKQESPWLVEFAKKRGVETVTKLTEAMNAMELDIDNNEGVYPYNGGRVTQAEVCRRAGIKPVTLQSVSHKTTTLIHVNSWIEKIKIKLITGKRNVRKTVTARADEWKSRHEAVCQSYHKDMLRLRDADIKLTKAMAEITRLIDDNQSLRAHLEKANNSKVKLWPRPSE